MRPLLALCLLAVSCGPVGEGEVEPTWQDHDLGTVSQGLGVGSVTGCSTGAVAPLTRQLIDELNCIQAGTMVDFRKPNISLGSTVNPFLAPNAATALQSAVNASGTSISVISAYRSVAQQYLLYKWWRASICGVPLASLPGASNHQSGRAVDVGSYSTWIPRLRAKGWTWLGSQDPAHFDFLTAPNFGSRSVLAFQKLWNKNRTNKLVEDGDWGPASEAAMANSPAEGFATSGCAPAPPATGTLRGKVFVLDPANPTDRSQGISGATVKVGGKTLTADATGAWLTTLDVGTYTVRASATGYQTATVSRAVTASQTVRADLGLAAVGVPDTQPPELVIDNPAAGASSDLASVVFEGTVSDAQGTVASLTVALNGAAAQPVTVQGGAFAHQLRLAPGSNQVAFAAIDQAGNVSRAELSVLFHSGLEGYVTADGEAGAPIEGAQVSLVDATGATFASTGSAADGSYAFELIQVPSTYTLRVIAEGFAAYEAEVTVPGDARRVWNAALIPGDGMPAVRLLAPLDGEMVPADEVHVSGVVAGFVPKRVEVNGRAVTADPSGHFELTLPIETGANVIEALAERADGLVFTDAVTVTRVTMMPEPSGQPVRGGCTATPALPMLLAALAFAAKRRTLGRHRA